MSNRTRKLIICALVLVVAVAAVVLILQNRKDQGPARLKEPVTVDVAMKLNRDGIDSMLNDMKMPIDESARPTVTAIEDIVDALTFRVTRDGQKSAMDLLLKDKKVLNLSAEVGGKGMKFVTDLLSNTLFSIDPSALSGSETPVSLSTPDAAQQEKMQKSADKYLNELEEKIKSSLGSEEKGSWTFGGQSFTARRPLNMTTKEMLAELVGFIKKVMADEAFADWTAPLTAGTGAADIDKFLDDLLNTEEDKLPAAAVYRYTAGNSTITEINVSDEQATLNMYFGPVGKETVFFCEMPGAIKVEGKADNAGYSAGGTMEINTAAGSASYIIRLVLSSATEKTGECSGTVAVEYSGRDLGTFTFRTYHGEAVSASFDEEGKTVLTEKELSDGTFMNTVSGKLMSGLLHIMTAANEVMPDQVSVLMSLMGGGFQ